LPQVTTWNLEAFLKEFSATKVPQGFKYNSGDNDQWVGIEDIRTLIKEHLDPDFK
jgi:hypothetical protein